MVSNNTIAGLVVAVILISLVGTVSTLTISKSAISGAIVGTANVTVGTSTTISLPTSNVDFGTQAVNTWNDTADDAPAPFTVQNDGTVKVNVTINATDLWDEESNPTSFYTFKAAASGEGTCYNGDETTTTYTNMPSTATHFIMELNYTDTCDLAEVELNVTVPSDEGQGAKGSTVWFFASQA